MRGEEQATPPAATKVLPKHHLQDIIKTHDFPQADFKQKAATTAAKALLSCYEKGLPMGPDEEFHDMAHELSLSIQESLAADAFPNADKPILKQRKALLWKHYWLKSWATKFTKKELSEAYSSIPQFN